MSTNVIGLDIGSRGVRGVELKNAASARPVVVKYHEVELPDGAANRGEVLDIRAVSDALVRLWSEGAFSSKDVIIGMGGSVVLSRELAMPLAPLSQVKEALPFHVQDMLPVAVAETILDFYPISEGESEQGPVVNGLLVAAFKDAVTANVAAVSGAGLRPVQVDLTPFALCRALSPRNLSQGLIAVVTIGATTTNVVITKDGVPQFVRIVSAGGEDVTEALALRTRATAEQADATKFALGLDEPSDDLEQREASDIIRDVTGELIGSIRTTLHYFVGKHGTPLDSVVLAGGGAHLRGLAGALRLDLGVHVEVREALTGATLSRAAAAKPSAHRDSMTTAYGLALGTKI